MVCCPPTRARSPTAGRRCPSFITRHESGQIPAEKLEAGFLYRFYASIAQAAFEKSPGLRQFSGLRQQDKLKAGLVRSHDDSASQPGGEI